MYLIKIMLYRVLNFEMKVTVHMMGQNLCKKMYKMVKDLHEEPS